MVDIVHCIHHDMNLWKCLAGGKEDPYPSIVE